MKVKVEKASLLEYKCDLAVVNLFEDVTKVGGTTALVDKALGGLISKLIKEGEISGKLGDCSIIRSAGKLPAERIAVAGLGRQKEFNLEKVRTAASAVVKKAKEIKARDIATKPAGAAAALVEGSLIGNYKFEGFKKPDPDAFNIETLIIVEPDSKKIDKIISEVEIAVLESQGVNRARDLVNLPANIATPTYLAEYAMLMAKEEKLKCEILDLADIQKAGMQAFYGVAKGSKEPAKLVVLKYKGRGSQTIGLVGKGITFDAGGISIKPSRHLSEMKTDMAGAAAVIEIMRLVARLKGKKNLMAVIPLTENMPDGAAYKPGDVLSSLSGKFIEVISTDAEGRMILADAITYARNLGADKIIDVATLTGGCTIALGDVASGIMGTDQALINQIKETGESVGEKLWELPLFEEYKEYLKSNNADIANCTESGKASPCTGGIFLQEFAGDTPWVHIDIAGTAYLRKERNYLSRGATGVLVRTLSRVLV